MFLRMASRSAPRSLGTTASDREPSDCTLPQVNDVSSPASVPLAVAVTGTCL